MLMILQTMSPVFIAGGVDSVYSPYMDYIVDKEEIVFIKKEKLLELFKDRKVIDMYMRKPFEYDLGGFLKYKYIGKYKNIKELEKRRVRFERKDFKGKKEIRGFISSPAGKYIPGSSIKGSIRTALLYKYVKERELKKEIYDNIVNSNHVNKKSVFKDSFSSKYLDEVKNCLRGIMVSDTDIIPDDKFLVADVDILHLKKAGKRFGVLRWEVLDREKTTTFKLKIKSKYPVAGGFWKFLEKEDYTTLFRYINEFSLDFIEHEIKALSEFESNETVKEMLDNYRERKDFIIKNNNKTAVMMIGEGTSFFSKTIDMLFDEKEMEKIRDRFKCISLGYKGGKKTKPFPVTRHIYPYSKTRLLGWVCILPADTGGKMS